jgi:hypothetical protein
MTPQNQAATQKALASVPTQLERPTVPSTDAEGAVPAVQTVLPEPGSKEGKRTSMWTLSATERRAKWLRMKHPKMDAKKRQLWAENG